MCTSESFWCHFPSIFLAFLSKSPGANQRFTRARGDCERPCFDQLNAHILERLLFYLRSKMSACSWSKHGRLQSPLGANVNKYRPYGPLWNIYSRNKINLWTIFYKCIMFQIEERNSKILPIWFWDICNNEKNLVIFIFFYKNSYVVIIA